MSYQVVVTFDLEDEESGHPYDCVKEQLAPVGLLNTSHSSTEPDGRLPRNTLLGDVDGIDANEVLQHVLDAVNAAFRQCEVQGLVFIGVAGQENRPVTTRFPQR